MDSHTHMKNARTALRATAVKHLDPGADPVAVALAALYVAHEMATSLNDDPFEGLGWMRSGMREMEQSLLRSKAAKSD